MAKNGEVKPNDADEAIEAPGRAERAARRGRKRKKSKLTVGKSKKLNVEPPPFRDEDVEEASEEAAAATPEGSGPAEAQSSPEEEDRSVNGDDFRSLLQNIRDVIDEEDREDEEEEANRESSEAVEASVNPVIEEASNDVEEKSHLDHGGEEDTENAAAAVNTSSEDNAVEERLNDQAEAEEPGERNGEEEEEATEEKEGDADEEMEDIEEEENQAKDEELEKLSKLPSTGEIEDHDMPEDALQALEALGDVDMDALEAGEMTFEIIKANMLEGDLGLDAGDDDVADDVADTNKLPSAIGVAQKSSEEGSRKTPVDEGGAEEADEDVNDNEMDNEEEERDENGSVGSFDDSLTKEKSPLLQISKLKPDSLTVCALCKTELKPEDHKLMLCLHAVCKGCVEAVKLKADLATKEADDEVIAMSGSGDVLPKKVSPMIFCTICKQTCKVEDLTDNHFFLDFLDHLKAFKSCDDSRLQDEENEEKNDDDGIAVHDQKVEDRKPRFCTNCDEEDEQAATVFCSECREWLCECCEKAHKRVKMTKEHELLPLPAAEEFLARERSVDGEVDKRDASDGDVKDAGTRSVFCKIHKDEVLQLFCETCDCPTCRDCQLIDHKDHSYKFIAEASQSHRQYLEGLLSKIREKRAYIDSAKDLIKRRYNEIEKVEQNVSTDIKQFAIMLIKEINERGKRILTDLTAVCGAKKSQLEEKNGEIVALCGVLDHCLHFVETALASGSNTALLTSKKLIVDKLNGVLKTRCEVPNPNHVVNIKFAYDKDLLKKHLSGAGQLLVDGLYYPAPPNREVTSVAPAPSSIIQVADKNGAANSVVTTTAPVAAPSNAPAAAPAAEPVVSAAAAPTHNRESTPSTPSKTTPSTSVAQSTISPFAKAALSGSDLVNSVKMRLKSLSGMPAEEKRAQMRAMAEELQKVTPEATADDIKRWMIEVVQQHNQQKVQQQQQLQQQQQHQQQQMQNHAASSAINQQSRIVDGRLHAEQLLANSNHVGNSSSNHPTSQHDSASLMMQQLLQKQHHQQQQQPHHPNSLPQNTRVANVNPSQGPGMQFPHIKKEAPSPMVPQLKPTPNPLLALKQQQEIQQLQFRQQEQKRQQLIQQQQQQQQQHHQQAQMSVLRQQLSQNPHLPPNHPSLIAKWRGPHANPQPHPHPHNNIPSPNHVNRLNPLNPANRPPNLPNVSNPGFPHSLHHAGAPFPGAGPPGLHRMPGLVPPGNLIGGGGFPPTTGVSTNHLNKGSPGNEIFNELQQLAKHPLHPNQNQAMNNRFQSPVQASHAPPSWDATTFLQHPSQQLQHQQQKLNGMFSPTQKTFPPASSAAMTPPPPQHPSWVTDPAPYTAVKVKEEPRPAPSEERRESTPRSTPNATPVPAPAPPPASTGPNLSGITMRPQSQSHTEGTPFVRYVKQEPRDGGYEPAPENRLNSSFESESNPHPNPSSSTASDDSGFGQSSSHTPLTSPPPLVASGSGSGQGHAQSNLENREDRVQTRVPVTPNAGTADSGHARKGSSINFTANLADYSQEYSSSQGSQRSNTDPNEDYCAVCQNGGDLLCCEFCPKVFHINCHIPSLNGLPSESEAWRCRLCQTPKPIEGTLRPTTGTKIQSEGDSASGLLPQELKICQYLCLRLMSVEESQAFHEPVPPSVPNYYYVIREPMDFSKIRKRLYLTEAKLQGAYDTIEDFLHEVGLIFTNCAKFNKPSSEVGEAGKKLEELFDGLVQKLLPDYWLHSFVRDSESPIDPAKGTRPKKKRKYVQPPEGESRA